MTTDVPAAIPFTSPVAEPTVAMAGLLLLHVPPGDALLKVVVKPAQILIVPAMPEGSGLTVMGQVTKQPVASV